MTISKEAELEILVLRNPLVQRILHGLRDFDLPDAWLVGGCLFQTVWNVLAGRTPTRAIDDYDVFYFDSGDLRASSEERANARAEEVFSDLACKIDVRNQARIHLWYADEFGLEGYPRLEKSTDGIDHFLAVCCMVAVRETQEGAIELYAPFGVDDVLERVVRPNPWFPNAPRDCYERKTARWQADWPELRVLPFSTPPKGLGAPANWYSSGMAKPASPGRAARPRR